MKRQIFLDTETTGLNPETGDRIIEIGCVEMVNRRLSGNDLHLYVNPQRSSHEDALKVHGLTDEFLADKPVFGDVAEQLLDYLDGADVIIHNAGFDLGFLDEELRRLGRPPLIQHIACVEDSLLMARDLYPGKANSLDALCRRLEVDNSDRTLHGALLDAGLLAEVYIRMTRGQESLVIDNDARDVASAAAQAVDFSLFDFVVIQASAVESAAHDVVMGEIDKASGQKTVWRARDAVPVPGSAPDRAQAQIAEALMNSQISKSMAETADAGSSPQSARRPRV